MSLSESRHPEQANPWPDLPHDEWADTLETLHMWSQIVGKIRMECSPWVNHSWGVPLYVSARGLGTSPIPHGNRVFQMEFDFLDHRLSVQTADGSSRFLSLSSRSVAEFYRELMEVLSEMALPVSIRPIPNEIPDPVPFPEDRDHATYEPGHARKLWEALVQADRVMKDFRARFTGKVSPVHFFWGSFDMAVTRFSGREAPEHPGGIPHLPDAVTREAYSHEVSSCGLWPGNRESPDPIFYSYAYPSPEGFSDAAVRPGNAFWLRELGEFVLPYEAVRSAASPDDALMAFFQSTYEAAADLGAWDRESLEWEPGYHPLGESGRGPLPAGS
jgi:hypothetical protein